MKKTLHLNLRSSASYRTSLVETLTGRSRQERVKGLLSDRGLVPTQRRPWAEQDSTGTCGKGASPEKLSQPSTSAVVYASFPPAHLPQRASHIPSWDCGGERLPAHSTQRRVPREVSSTVHARSPASVDGQCLDRTSVAQSLCMVFKVLTAW